MIANLYSLYTKKYIYYIIFFDYYNSSIYKDDQNGDILVYNIYNITI